MTRHLPLIAALIAVAATPALADGLVLKETGSTLVYPLFQQWAAAYATMRPGSKIETAGTNSGTGIAAAIDGSAQIGTSDAYMSDEDAERNRQIISIPLAISAQTVNYNVPELKTAQLKLDGPTIAGIYFGTITSWDDPAIAAMNPGVTLPHHNIVAIRRGDVSGDTFVFTQFLDFSTQKWEDRIGYGTNVTWPSVDGEQQVNGNDGMVKAITATRYSIGYVGISFHADLEKAGAGTAMLKNQTGQFVLPTTETITTAAAMLDRRTPADERLSLAYAPGDNAYPLVNYEYAMVSTNQPNQPAADAIRKFLLWSISVDGGNATKFLDSIGFIPLPDFIRAMSEHQIDRIKVANTQ
jgi:phosphate transport system substrate-binding protein